jgi:hypothetical protein
LTEDLRFNHSTLRIFSEFIISHTNGELGGCWKINGYWFNPSVLKDVLMMNDYGIGGVA